MQIHRVIRPWVDNRNQIMRLRGVHNSINKNDWRRGAYMSITFHSNPHQHNCQSINEQSTWLLFNSIRRSSTSQASQVEAILPDYGFATTTAKKKAPRNVSIWGRTLFIFKVIPWRQPDPLGVVYGCQSPSHFSVLTIKSSFGNALGKQIMLRSGICELNCRCC